MNENSSQAPVVSAYEDPEGEAPWAMQLVAFYPKPTPEAPGPTHTATLEAAASACVRLLDAVATRGSGSDRAAVDRWLDGRIRKVVRRARGAAWDRAHASAYVSAQVGDAVVAAYLPGPTDQVDEMLRKLQVSGLQLDDPTPTDSNAPGLDGSQPEWVTVYLNPQVALTTGKAAAQVAHAAQLVYQGTSGVQRDEWVAAGAPVRVITPTALEWDRGREKALVSITDAGFTEIAPGTETALGLSESLQATSLP